jgi:hypothetical protein
MSLQTTLKSQYYASLAMLRGAIETCPAELWTSARYVNPFWQVAYHTLFYTHLYLQPAEADFVPWEHHREEHHRFGADPERGDTTLIPYSVDEIQSYWRYCEGMVNSAVDRLDLTAPESGFYWYRMSKLEHQFVNLRHIQHHTGQLADRLRQEADRGVEWVGGMSKPAAGELRG